MKNFVGNAYICSLENEEVLQKSVCYLKIKEKDLGELEGTIVIWTLLLNLNSSLKGRQRQAGGMAVSGVKAGG